MASNGRFYVDSIILIDNSAQDAIGAYGYAAQFINATNEECANANVSSGTWTTLSSSWTSLDSEAKAYIAGKNANKDGNVIEEALARYEIIVKGYGYTNFMSRTVGANRLMIVNIDNSAVMTFVIIAIVLTTTTGAIFLLRKKKEER